VAIFRSAPADLLYQDMHGGIMAECETSAVYLTQDRAIAGDFCDKGLFAETHFSYPLAKFVAARQIAHSAQCARRELAQRNEIYERETTHVKGD